MAIPDQRNKVFLVTGANTGIGRETAAALAGAGATVAITSRDRARGERALGEIRAGAGPDADVQLLMLDLASLASVRACADEVLTRFDRLDVLINNAGALIGDRRTTADGFELTIGANHLAPFLLTELLRERLTASAPSRVVNVASIAHRGAARVDLDAATGPGAAVGPYEPMGTYNQSKLANVLFTTELARRMAGTGVTAFAVHPGGVRSEFGLGDDTKGLLRLGVAVIRPLEISPRTGAQATLHCATAPGIEDRSGGYFQKRLFGNFGPVTEVAPTPAARDEAAAKALWEASERALASA